MLIDERVKLVCMIVDGLYYGDLTLNKVTSKPMMKFLDMLVKWLNLWFAKQRNNNEFAKVTDQIATDFLALRVTNLITGVIQDRKHEMQINKLTTELNSLKFEKDKLEKTLSHAYIPSTDTGVAAG